MKPPRRPGASDAASVRDRRARLVTTALAGLALPIASGACTPKPCLKVAPPPTATAQDRRSFAMSAPQAAERGLPAIGFSFSWGERGFEPTEPTDRRTYVEASGPPGGPQRFAILAYAEGDTDRATLAALFNEALGEQAAGAIAGNPESVTLAARSLDAQAFRTGSSAATTDWCLVQVTSPSEARAGALVLFGVAASGPAPTCSAVLGAEAFTDIVATLKIE